MAVLRCEACPWRRDYGAGVTPWRDRCPECGGRAFAAERAHTDDEPSAPAAAGQIDMFGGEVA